MTELTWTVDAVEAQKVKTLALILTDPNPIHFDRAETARALGTGGKLIVQGPMSVAFVYNLFAEHLPGRLVRSVDARLHGTIQDGDQVTVRAVQGAGTADRYEVSVYAGDRPVLTATAELAPADAPGPG
jgi:hypothetical protein